MSDVLDYGEAQIMSFGLEGLAPSSLPFMVVGTGSTGAIVTSGVYFGAEPTHGLASWPAPSRSDWVDDAAERITHLSTLRAGWDGRRARPIDRNVLLGVWEVAKRLAAARLPSPAFIPMVSGGVALEWHRNGIDLELEVGTDGATLSYEDDAGTEVEGKLGEHVEFLAEALFRLR